MKIAQNIDDFMKEIYNNSNHRYTSWEICFKAFRNDDVDEKIKALHLAGYLASWGMYRGSSKLLSNYNYLIFKDLVPILSEYMDLRKDFLEDSDYDRFLDLVKKIRKFLEDKDISKTNTLILITKIILGVYGCFPALDKYFKKGFKSYNGIKISIFQKNVFKTFYENIKSFYSANQDIFEMKRRKIGANIGIDYPPMKLIDMCFWEEGKNGS